MHSFMERLPPAATSDDLEHTLPVVNGELHDLPTRYLVRDRIRRHADPPLYRLTA
jgi:hypothetical protein